MQDSVERRKALKRSNLAETGPNLVKTLMIHVALQVLRCEFQSDITMSVS